MSKKIVVITGSPRKNGNSFAMTDAFIKAAEAKGHTVTRFDAAMKKVGGCRACETCFSTGKACTFDDDFNIIAPAILEADAVVFTMPVYWYSIPAQIKGVIDRIFSLVVGGKDITGKECALISCCEEEDMSVMAKLFPFLRGLPVITTIFLPIIKSSFYAGLTLIPPDTIIIV